MGSEKGTYHIMSRGSVSDRAIAFAALSWEASKRTTTFFLHGTVAMKDFLSVCVQGERFEIRFGLKFRSLGLGRTVRQTIEATRTIGRTIESDHRNPGSKNHNSGGKQKCAKMILKMWILLM
jgi:hypothetical protein